MNRESLFEEFLKECEYKEQICGSGNHISNILLVGNEHYSEKPIKSDDDWKKYLMDNYNYCKTNKTWSNFNKSKTWLYYQKLIDETIPQRQKPTMRGERNFEEDAFTTELNSEAKPSSNINREGLKERIESRLELFKHSDFIKSFPVVVLACGSYLMNCVEKGVTQINDTFAVEFDKEINKEGVPTGWHKSKEGKLWFTTHHSKDKQKLVIHTWQFSLRYTSAEDREWLINDMASVIRNHLTKLGLI